MSECKRENCEEEAACSYNNEYCSSTCEIMSLRKQLKASQEEVERSANLIKHIVSRIFLAKDCMISEHKALISIAESIIDHTAQVNEKVTK